MFIYLLEEMMNLFMDKLAQLCEHKNSYNSICPPPVLIQATWLNNYQFWRPNYSRVSHKNTDEHFLRTLIDTKNIHSAVSIRKNIP